MMRNLKTMLEATPKGDGRLPLRELVRRLLIARDSDEHDFELFRAMIDQTCRRFRDRPGVSEALAAGLDPLHHPEAYDAQVYRDRRNKAVLFLIDGTLFLYWMGSAALRQRESDTIKEENAFCNFVADLVDAYAPEELLVATFSRLVRSEEYSPKVRQACINHEVVVRADEASLDMATEMGQMQWTMLAMMAANERKRILSRLLLGIIHDARNHGAPYGDEQLPPGYERVDGVVRPDPAMREPVARMWEILADGSLTAREQVAELARCGIERKRMQRLHGQDSTVGQARDPAQLIRSLRAWRPLYESGVWTIRRDCPVTGIDEFGGLTVHRDADGSRYVDIPYHWGLPDGGWVDADVLRAAKAAEDTARARSGRTGGASRSHRRLLAGIGRWHHDGFAYALLAAEQGTYVIKRRPITGDGQLDGDWEHVPAGWADGIAIDEQTLHRHLAEAITEAITGGVGISLNAAAVDLAATGGGPRSVVIDAASRRRHLEDQLADARRIRDAHIDLAARSTGELAERYHDHAADTQQRIDDLAGELDADDDRGGQAPAEVVCHAESVLAALANLANARGPVAGDLADATAAVLKHLRVDLTGFDPAQPTVTVAVDVQLPGDGHVLTLHDITAELPARPIARSSRRDGPTGRDAQALADLTDGHHPAAIAERLGLKPRTVHNRLLTVLHAAGTSPRLAKAAVTHPLAIARATLTAMATGAAPTADLPDGYRDRLERTYAPHDDAPELRINSPAAHRAAKLRQTAVDRIAEHGGAMTAPALFEELDDTISRSSSSLSTLAADSGGQPPALLDRRREHGEVILSLRRCPHCHTAATCVLDYPETRGLHCHRCKVNIDDPDQVELPAAYLHGQAPPPPATSPTSPTRSVTRQHVLETIPTLDNHDGWTLRELTEASGAAPNTVRRLVTEGRHHGWITEVGPCPHHTGAGMVPTRWRLTHPDQPHGGATEPTNPSQDDTLAALPDGDFTRGDLLAATNYNTTRVSGHLRRFRTDGLLAVVDRLNTQGSPMVMRLTDRGHTARTQAQQRQASSVEPTATTACPTGGQPARPSTADVLDRLAADTNQHGYTINELAADTGLHPSTIRLLIRDGQRAGWLRQPDPTTDLPDNRARWTAADPTADLHALYQAMTPRHGWTAAEEVLAAAPHQPFTAADLRDTMTLRSNAINNAIKTLIDHGHLTYHNQPDSRRSHVELTDQGRRRQHTLTDR